MAQRDHILHYVEGDTRPVESVTLLGVGDITGWTIALHIDRNGDPISVPGLITNGPEGEFEFSFSSTDLVPGVYPAQIFTQDLAGDVQRLPRPPEQLVLDVREKIL